MKLKNKVAVVTGSSRGIGRATAIELARNGADVAVNAYSHPEEGQEVVREIQALGRRSFLFQGSVADRAQDEAMVRETVERLGRLDIMVANAAYSIRKPFLEMEVEEVEKTWGVTLWGVFHCCQLAARQMVKQGDGGSIAIVSSVHAFRPYALSTAYNGAKAAINHMSATWAAELAQYRIRVNVFGAGLDRYSRRTRLRLGPAHQGAGQQVADGSSGHVRRDGQGGPFHGFGSGFLLHDRKLPPGGRRLRAAQAVISDQ